MLSVLQGTAVLAWAAMIFLATQMAVGTFRNHPPPRWWQPSFQAALVIALILCRLPSILFNGQINVDESQVLAQAMRCSRDPTPWHGFVGGSGGPFNTYVLLWQPLAGFPVSFAASRVTAIVLQWAMLSGLQRGIQEILSARLSALFILPAATLFITAMNLDFMFCAGELLPAALCSWVVAGIAIQQRRPRRGRAFMIGVACGMLPFTKIQVAPVAVALWIAACSMTPRSTDKSLQWPCRLWLVAGAMVMPLSMSVCFTMQQTWQDFMSFYIRYGATYNSGGMLDVPPWRLLFLTSTQFTAYWVALMLSISGVVAWAKGRERWQSIPREKAVVCLAACAYCFVTACVTTWTRTGLTHYLLLMVCPLSLVAASIASLPDRTYQRRGRVWVPCILVVLGLQVAATGVEWQRKPWMTQWWPEAVHPVVEELMPVRRDGDQLFVWGWAPQLHVLSGMSPATRFAVSGWSSPESKTTPLYSSRLLEDLAASRPRFIVDATGEFQSLEWPKGKAAMLEGMPRIAEWILREYRLVRVITTDAATLPYRIWVRRGS